MVKKKRESFWRKYSYIASWLSLIGIMGIIVKIYFLLGGDFIILPTGIKCHINYSDNFNQFLQNKCNELSIGEGEYLQKEIVSRFVGAPKGAVVKEYKRI